MTRFFILAVIALVIFYDMYAFFTHRLTLSEQIWEWSTKHPMVPFIAGVVCGHLFWRH